MVQNNLSGSLIHPIGIRNGGKAMTKPYETRPATSSNKKASGFCIICASAATTEALFKIDGAIVIQRYCDACLRNAKY